MDYAKALSQIKEVTAYLEKTKQQIARHQTLSGTVKLIAEKDNRVKHHIFTPQSNLSQCNIGPELTIPGSMICAIIQEEFKYNKANIEHLIMQVNAVHKEINLHFWG